MQTSPPNSLSSQPIAEDLLNTPVIQHIVIRANLKKKPLKYVLSAPQIAADPVEAFKMEVSKQHRKKLEREKKKVIKEEIAEKFRY
ncbi:hypothetical protein Ddc_14832 [Ditylenchus destructor]|nr:hypothetical protein Ddc_14832 [Ditylenchus destructor]